MIIRQLEWIENSDIFTFECSHLNSKSFHGSWMDSQVVCSTPIENPWFRSHFLHLKKFGKCTKCVLFFSLSFIMISDCHMNWIILFNIFNWFFKILIVTFCILQEAMVISQPLIEQRELPFTKKMDLCRVINLFCCSLIAVGIAMNLVDFTRLVFEWTTAKEFKRRNMNLVTHTVR